MPAGYELCPTLNDALTTREPGKVAALRQHQLLYALGEDCLAPGEVWSFFWLQRSLQQPQYSPFSCLQSRHLLDGHNFSNDVINSEDH